MTWSVIVGDAAESLRSLPAESVQCVVTSPPYWGLRDYGTAAWEGGTAGCDHIQQFVPRTADDPGIRRSTLDGGKGTTAVQASARSYRDRCGKCGAVRQDQQLGLEPTPELYVEHMVEVLREVRRVLRKDGTVWLNLGDSYAGGGGFSPNAPSNLAGAKQTTQKGAKPGGVPVVPGLKPKDLVGIPWRVAFALQADGWWLRSDIIWAKPNPMPESVTDRPTKAHEYVFLLAKSARYFYDADAVREAPVYSPAGSLKVEISRERNVGGRTDGFTRLTTAGGVGTPDGGRNLRTVWNIATEPFPQAHFATFPTALVEPCIKAGTSEKGCCPECGAPWARVVEHVDSGVRGKMPDGWDTGPGGHTSFHRNGREKGEPGIPILHSVTTGWRPTCSHEPDPIPCVILDPFAGSGTVGVVACQLERSFIGIELNPVYAEMAERRIHNEAGLFSVQDSVK